MSRRPVGFEESVDGPGSLRARKERERRATELQSMLAQLSPEEQAFYQKNPHIQQNVACARPLRSEYLFTEKDRIIELEKAPRERYVERKEEIKTTVHVGQRKLFDTEAEFITRFTNPREEIYVVYAGGAGGRHHEILDKMFPNVHFLLYDPNPFSVRSENNREIFQEFFTTSTAQELATRFRRENKRCLFISDIRRVITGSSLMRQKLVLEDLEMQKIWLQILDPGASLLKFVMPYPMPKIPDKITYLDGIVFLQPWAGATSTETRLLVTNNQSQKVYDVREYEEVLFYHNTVTRTTYYQEIAGVPSEIVSCHCYDCAAELYILNQYAQKYQPNLNIPDLLARLDAFGVN
jgi:hypothetical protein